MRKGPGRETSKPRGWQQTMHLIQRAFADDLGNHKVTATRTIPCCEWPLCYYLQAISENYIWRKNKY